MEGPLSAAVFPLPERSTLCVPLPSSKCQVPTRFAGTKSNASPPPASWIAICAVTPDDRAWNCDSPNRPPVELLTNAPAVVGLEKSVVKLKTCDHGAAVPSPVCVRTRQ